MDADYLSLAVWALSRVFVRPGKLRWDGAKMTTVKEEKEESTFFGGGGMGEEPSCGNDAMYKTMSSGDTTGNEWNTRAEIRSIREEINQGFYLTGNIVIPNMEDIVDEILLQPKHSSSESTSTGTSYEYNDAHSSNAHRFYLLNGLASGGGGTDDKIAPVTPSNNPRSPRSQQQSLALHGGPLTFGEIVHAGITSLGARTRILAEKEMVFHNPLFEQFVKAVSSKGFFSEKKKDERKKGDPAPSAVQAFLTPEEEQRRSKVLYEEKYRKVVNKFRSKLAAKAEANQPQQNYMQQFQYGPMHQQYAINHQQSPQYHGYQSNMIHNHPGAPQSMNISAATVADLQRRKRKVKIDKVRAGGRDGYALNQERGQMQQQMNYQKQHQLVQQQMQQNQQVQQHHQHTHVAYQPLHQVQLQQSPQRPPSQLQQPEQQKLSPPVKTQLKPPLGQWDTPKSQKHWPGDSTKSTLSTKFNFDSRASPFDKPTPNSKPPTPSRPNQSQSPSVLTQTETIPQPQPTPRLHEPESEDDELNQYEAEQLNADGNKLMQKKQFEEALEVYTAALKLCPSGPNSHVYYSNRSAAHLSLNDHASSIRDSESSLNLCPGYAKAHSRVSLIPLLCLTLSQPICF